MLIDSELKALIKRYHLSNDELYRHSDKLMLMNAKAIRKIITTEKLNVSKRIEFAPDGTIAVICRVENGDAFSKGHVYYEAIGEAKPGLNTAFKYPVAVAEARANGRAVLMYAGLYEKGIIAEAELESETESQEIINKRRVQVELSTSALLQKIKKS